MRIARAGLDLAQVDGLVDVAHAAFADELHELEAIQQHGVHVDACAMGHRFLGALGELGDFADRQARRQERRLVRVRRRLHHGALGGTEDADANGVDPVERQGCARVLALQGLGQRLRVGPDVDQRGGGGEELIARHGAVAAPLENAQPLCHADVRIPVRERRFP